MQLTDDRKRGIERKIVGVLIKGLYENVVTLADLPQMSGYLFENMIRVTNQEQLMAFLKDISSRWEIFTSVFDEENIPLENMPQDEKNKTVQDIANLARDGEIDEAIDMAKKTTGVSS